MEFDPNFTYTSYNGKAKDNVCHKKYCSDISLKGLRKITKNLNHFSWYPGSDSNQAPPTYESRELPLLQATQS
jgi:hypothetical protein